MNAIEGCTTCQRRKRIRATESAAEIMITVVLGQAGCGGWQPGSGSTSDVMRKLNDLRLEEKRSMREVENLRSPSQERETQKTVAFFHSVVEVVCGFCQDHHTLSECMNLKQASHQKREKATRYQLCSPASSRSVSPQLASVIDERIVYNIWTN
ncbi:hypothetical protein T12_6350 [Trichinella patagoniensis]|uniref:Uncharacterized protein n=1 Tax=Trichinella patagoniensis TaxID=990121 RepID=A0A0V0ZSM3_9BILA|nr:hypothetical protein T12_6350 [Trichinella patagoniensis]